MQLAQINIARMLAPLESAAMREFRGFLAPVNMLAERSPGFVWRYSDLNAKIFVLPWDDEFLIVNMSVWKDVDSLRRFTHHTVHAYFMNSRNKWFHQLDHPYSVLWWVKDGYIPTLNEGKAKLALLEKNGPSLDAFPFQQAESFQWK